MPTAILFPGQGSQAPDMRDDVAERRPDLLDLVTLARALNVAGACVTAGQVLEKMLKPILKESARV